MYIKRFKDIMLSESVQYHIDNGYTLLESVFRIESDSWISLINEARQLYINGNIELTDVDKWLVTETQAGLTDYYENELVLLDVPFLEEDEILEAEYRGKEVNLNKPFRTPGEKKKYAVYTKNGSGNVVKVRFGDPKSRVKNYDAKRAKSFQARHKCEDPGVRWKARYWSCNLHRYAKLLGLKSKRKW